VVLAIHAVACLLILAGVLRPGRPLLSIAAPIGSADIVVKYVLSFETRGVHSIDLMEVAWVRKRVAQR
jgi:hypothetical protein